MTLIYSSKTIQGISGSYIDPFRFDGVEQNVKVVYTDDAKIAEAYKADGVEVKPITKKRKPPNKEAE